MKRQIILTGFAVALLALTGTGFGQTAAERIQAGDGYYAEYNDQKALEEYLAAVQMEASNYEALWKTSRAYVDTADLLSPAEKDSKETRKKMYENAVTYARKAIAANPNDTWGHFCFSAAMGKKVLLQGKKEQIDASKVVKIEIDKAIELDASNDLAYHALGRWHRRMAEIGGAKRALGSLFYGSIPKGSFTESEKLFLKAIEIRPDYVNHHYELGLTYEALEKFDLAAAEFQKAIDLPVSSSKDKGLKEDARIALEKALKKKK
jgi:tetratricopeptide (TPR) repeat protein